MITAVFLANALDAHVSFAPFLRDGVAAAVSGGLFEARRLHDDETAEHGEHLGQTRRQYLQVFFGWMRCAHGRDILAAQPTCGNRAIDLRKQLRIRYPAEMRCAGVDAGRGPSRLRVNKPRPYKVRSEKSH